MKNKLHFIKALLLFTLIILFSFNSDGQRIKYEKRIPGMDERLDQSGSLLKKHGGLMTAGYAFTIIGATTAAVGGANKKNNVVYVGAAFVGLGILFQVGSMGPLQRAGDYLKGKPIWEAVEGEKKSKNKMYLPDPSN